MASAVNVATPATEVVKVAASAAGATSAGGCPAAIRTGERGEDGAAADAVDAVGASDQAGESDQGPDRDLPGRDRGDRRAWRPADGEPAAHGQQDSGDDEREDARSGEQFDADD
jgi:hypothetical protein